MRNLANFSQALESPKSWNSICYICLKTTFFHLKHYLQIYLTLLLTDLWFGKWHEQYGKFFQSTQNWDFDGIFNPNLKKYELKIHRGVTCHDNEELCKIWRGTDLSFQSWHEEFDEFWPEQLKVSKNFILMGSFWSKYILLKLKKDAKFGEESTCRFKIGIRNFTNFDLSTQKSQNFSP